MHELDQTKLLTEFRDVRNVTIGVCKGILFQIFRAYETMFTENLADFQLIPKFITDPLTMKLDSKS